MIDAETTDGGFSLVEHPMSARALAAPLHRHLREDEYSYVVEGRMGALLGEDVLEAGPGDLVFKPRGEWHTFWNAGDDPCRILEIIAPAGFERFFAELVELGGVAQADPAVLGNLCERYALEIDPPPASPGSSSASACASLQNRSRADRGRSPFVPDAPDRLPERDRGPSAKPPDPAGSNRVRPGCRGLSRSKLSRGRASPQSP